MPRYTPIAVPAPLVASQSDLVSLHWSHDRVVADFALPSAAAQVLRAVFAAACVVRILDEMALSTEADLSANVGLVAEHFAYRVEGTAFEAAQSAAWRHVHAPLSNWRLITGGGCLDVLCAATPSFTVRERSARSELE